MELVRSEDLKHPAAYLIKHWTEKRGIEEKDGGGVREGETREIVSNWNIGRADAEAET